MPPRGRNNKNASATPPPAVVEELEPVVPTEAAEKQIKKDAKPQLNLPPPDADAVQRLVDSALLRAHETRGTTPRHRPAPGPEKKCRFSCITKYFGRNAVMYTPKTTSFLTDLVGVFLVVLFAIYFTTAGYLYYRESALTPAK